MTFFSFQIETTKYKRYSIYSVIVAVLFIIAHAIDVFVHVIEESVSYTALNSLVIISLILELGVAAWVSGCCFSNKFYECYKPPVNQEHTAATDGDQGGSSHHAQAPPHPINTISSDMYSVNQAKNFWYRG